MSSSCCGKALAAVSAGRAGVSRTLWGGGSRKIGCSLASRRRDVLGAGSWIPKAGVAACPVNFGKLTLYVSPQL